MEETAVKLGLRMPNFYRTDGNYERLQMFIDNGTVTQNSYVYDSSTKKLIHVNTDKTWNFIGGDAELVFTSLTGTSEAPIHIDTLMDGMYIVQGNYIIKNTDTDFYAKAPVMVLIEVDAEDPTIIHATIYTSNGCTMYKIESDKTTIDKLVTEETVIGVVNEVVEEQVTEIVEETLPEVLDDNIRPASDQEIDDMIDHIFDNMNNGGGD